MSAPYSTNVVVHLNHFNTVDDLLINPIDTLDSILQYVNQTYKIPIDQLEVRDQDRTIPSNSLIGDNRQWVIVCQRIIPPVKLLTVAVRTSYLKDGKVKVLTDVLRQVNSNRKIISLMDDIIRLHPSDGLEDINWLIYHYHQRMNVDNRISEYIDDGTIIDLRQEGLIRIRIDDNGRELGTIADINLSLREALNDMGGSIFKANTIRASHNGVDVNLDLPIRETTVIDESKIVFSY